MKKVRILSIIAAGIFAMSSMAQPAPKVVKAKDPNTKKTCSANACTIAVTVNSCTDGGIDIDAFTLTIDKGQGKSVEWTIIGNGKFTSKTGINFKDNQTNFTNPQLDPQAGGKKLKLDSKQAKGTFSYNIDVQVGDQTCRVDPIIVNN